MKAILKLRKFHQSLALIEVLGGQGDPDHVDLGDPEHQLLLHMHRESVFTVRNIDSIMMRYNLVILVYNP